jgi:DNA mismatch repair ATPase MutS
MRVLLMHRNRDFDLYQLPSSSRYGRRQDVDRGALLRNLLWNAPALLQDLELDTLLRAMAGGDEFVFEVAQQALFSGFTNDVDTILYRQAMLKDCVKNPAVVKGLYDLMTAVGEQTRRQWWGFSSDYPGSMLYSSVELMETFIGVLRQLRRVAEEHAASFASEGFSSMFAMLRKELGEEYLATIKNHLRELQFRKGALISAQLGADNEGTKYMLRQPYKKEPNWLDRVLGKGPPGYTFHVDPRDESGGKILTDMRNRGIVRVARALAESAEHVLGFFKMLRTELAFYIGGLRLHGHLLSRGMPVAFPTPRAASGRRHEFSGLYDVCLALTMNRAVVANTISANRKNLIIITGANQGGKSTFLRSVGLAQLMMQCGLFVGAEAFEAEICPALFTHSKREEDTTMNSGKFDEELARMSEIADHMVPNSILLFNESFAATNEREGSDIATQIVRALLEKGMKIFYVTHLFEFASGFYEDKSDGALFLRAERLDDGTRTFRLVEGEPLQTSYGEDVYHQVFAVEDEIIETLPRREDLSS